MSKMGKLYLESENEEIAFNNSQYEEELTGICSKCYDGANFNDLNDEGE